jgi:hypothetical protein
LYGPYDDRYLILIATIVKKVRGSYFGSDSAAAYSLSLQVPQAKLSSIFSGKVNNGNWLMGCACVTHLLKLCFCLIVGHHRNGRSVVGFQALGNGLGGVIYVLAALVPLEKAVGHGVC